jgi:nitric oxide reductase subunit B
MMGVFGMLGIGLIVFVIRQSVTQLVWLKLEKYVRLCFWGLNVGLLMMVVLSLFPAGILQLLDVLENGYWHARSIVYTGSDIARILEWSRFPGDLVFIIFGAIPITIVAIRAYFSSAKQRGAQ